MHDHEEHDRGAHGHKFDPAHAARLDDPRRAEMMPPAPVVEALGLRSGDRVADIGCGTGHWLRALLDAAPPDTRFAAVDSEPRMLALLEERLAGHPRRGHVEVVRSTERTVPLHDASIDAAVMGSLYHELADRPGFLVELRRLIAPGGRIAIVDWAPLPEGVEPEMGPPSAHRVAFATAKAEVEAAGFGDAREIAGFRESWCLVAVREA